MQVVVNFDNGSIYCMSCAGKLNLKITKNRCVVETWDKTDFEHRYCLKCEIEVYEGSTRNGQHLAMFI